MKRAPFLLAAAGALVLSGCYDPMAASMEINRRSFNTAMESCNATHRCKAAGDFLAGKDFQTKVSSWNEPIDLAAAREVYAFGCNSGDGQACIRLVELKLGTTPGERARYRSLSYYYGTGERSPEQIAEEDALANDLAAQSQEYLDRDVAEEAANRAQLYSTLAGALPVAAASVPAAHLPLGNTSPGSTPHAGAGAQASRPAGHPTPSSEPPHRGGASSDHVAQAENRFAAQNQAQQQQQQQIDEAAKAQARLKAKQDLDVCLATDVSCDYGTDPLCVPSVPYSDQWGERFELQKAQQILQTCDPKDTGNLRWMGAKPGAGADACKDHVFSVLPDMTALASKASSFESRVGSLPPDLAAMCPGPAPDPGDSETIRQLTFWCNNSASDCATHLQSGFDTLLKELKIDSCLWGVEMPYERKRLKAQHDSDCQQKYQSATAGLGTP